MKQILATLLIGFILMPLQAHAGDYSNTNRSNLKDIMQNRQEEVEEIYDDLDLRVKQLDARDPKKKCLTDSCAIGPCSTDDESSCPYTGVCRREDNDEFVCYAALLDQAKAAKNAFKNVSVENNIDPVAGGFTSSSAYDRAEDQALAEIKSVQRYIISPLRPGEVPEGDIIEDFIPQAVRLLFRFASLAVLISFVVSGVMLVISFDNEERVTKAKQMLLYTFVGFIFVVMAFALVNAITDIDFFGFV